MGRWPAEATATSLAQAGQLSTAGGHRRISGRVDPQARYPQLVAAQGRCPPEDVGGPPGYAEFLAAIADPAHEDHDHMLTWYGGAFDPENS